MATLKTALPLAVQILAQCAARGPSLTLSHSRCRLVTAAGVDTKP